jgi:glyoxylase-like metal-dependent hydrolase (beta-lactamase superfamily II)
MLSRKKINKQMIEIDNFEEITQIRMSREIEGKPVYWVSAYIVDGLLIDTGCSYTADELLEYLEDKGVKLAVNTHFHEDHIGANKILMVSLGIDIFAHPDSVKRISEKIKLYPYQETVWGYPEPTTVKPVPDKIKTDNYAFQVIETPGHSIGHIALVELSKGWCFSGDIFSRENLKFIRPEEDVSLMIKSMRSLIDLPCERLVLLTSVGKIVKDGRKALSACIDYLSVLASRVKTLEKNGLGIRQIIDEVFGGEHNFSAITNNQYSTYNFVKSLLVCNN